MTSRAVVIAAAALVALPLRGRAQYMQPVFMPPATAAAAPITAPARGEPHRYPAVGATLGFIPGLGHAYSSEWRRGGIIFAVTMTGAYFALNDASPDAAAAAGSIFYVGGWLFSMVDGAFAADRFNRRHRVTAIARNH